MLPCLMMIDFVRSPGLELNMSDSGSGTTRSSSYILSRISMERSKKLSFEFCDWGIGDENPGSFAISITQLLIVEGGKDSYHSKRL